VTSTAELLFGLVANSGAAAAGLPAWGLKPGARADALVADLGEAALLGVPADRLLDALVFSSPARPWRDVMVAGRWVIRARLHAQHEGIAHRFEGAMRAL